MVESKFRARAHFALFIIPCLVLYTVFFLYPFGRGIYISLTNWDGLTPKAPIVIPQSHFEDAILSKIKNPEDKKYLLSIYTFHSEDHEYRRIALSTMQRIKVERILSGVDYEPDNYKFVGFENYKKILDGKVKDSFYPSFKKIPQYSATSNLPEIPKRIAAAQILSRFTSEQKQAFNTYYQLKINTYVPNPDYDTFTVEGLIWDIPEYAEKGIPDDSEIDAFIRGINNAAADFNYKEKDLLVRNFLSAHQFSTTSKEQIEKAAAILFDLTGFKSILAESWIVTSWNMGVVGFTLFFTLFSVIGINVLAFLLALALDTDIKGKNVFRSLFFLPNVLSMIIVALIWKQIFFQIMPALTGIELWMGDSNKTPWLLVMVAVWQGCGYYMIVYLAGLQNIPTDVVEASLIDGANGWQRFKSITIPLLIPAITVSFFLTIANALKSFDLVYAMIGTTGYAMGTVPFVMDIFFDAFANKEAGLATAKAMLLFVVIFIITGAQLIILKRKEVEQ